MFFKLIERLQQKPEHARRKIGFIASFAITALVGIAWLLVFDVGDPGSAATSTAATASAGPSPIESFKELFSNLGESIERNAEENPPPELPLPAETYGRDPTGPMPPEGAFESGL